jgi:aspartyl-tRNA(Asn)/glutamyl-tRNA(Gln) amidotransferase subunit A
LEQAAIVDEKINSGKAGKLAGLVVGIKDVLVLKDHEVNASSKILKGFKSQFTSHGSPKIDR